MKSPTDFCICICTYKRPNLLRNLLGDLNKQTILPNKVIIVDGDPESGLVQDIGKLYSSHWKTIYMPSNHANAPFQRYLGARFAEEEFALVYLDDDLRINQPDFLELLLAPLKQEAQMVAGVTSQIFYSNRNKDEKKTTFHYKLITLPNVVPGDISPVGYRTYPEYTGQPYLNIRWLHGGVMAYRVDAIHGIGAKIDAFAMSHVGCGLGVDDTYLARCALEYGNLLLAFHAIAEHPDADESQIASINRFANGFAAAYSRRFLNDNFRITTAPRFLDRLALVKTYLGNNGLNLWRTICHPDKKHIGYSLGYFQGSIQGIFKRPTADKLTPDINWLKDADEAIKNAVEID